MRDFIRHPAEIPIEVHPEESASAAGVSMDVGAGGIAFRSSQVWPVGSTVRLRIALTRPAFEARARVVWSRCQGRDHLIGVQFLEREDQYRARMVEQICHIEHYRREVRTTEGRVLSAQGAAEEWIGKYANRFPGAGKEG